MDANWAVVLALGFFLMAGGKSPDPNVLMMPIFIVSEG